MAIMYPRDSFSGLLKAYNETKAILGNKNILDIKANLKKSAANSECKLRQSELAF